VSIILKIEEECTLFSFYENMVGRFSKYLL